MLDLPPEVFFLVKVYIIFLVVIVFYAFITNRLRAATNRFRSAFAVMAEKLLTEDLPPGHEKSLRFALEHALDGRLPWLFVLATIIYPVRRLIRTQGEILPIKNETVSARCTAALLLWYVSVMGLSPIGGLLMLLSLIILAILTSAPSMLVRMFGLVIGLDQHLAQSSWKHPHRKAA